MKNVFILHENVGSGWELKKKDWYGKPSNL